MTTNLRPQLRAAVLIGMRGFRSAMLGLGPYLFALAVCLLVAAYLAVYVGGIEEEGLTVMNGPLNLPFFLVVGLSAIYLALAASISISRERDLGTLEVLFHGPVDAVSFVAAKYLEQILVFTVMACMYGLVFLALGELTNLGFSWRFLLGMALSLGIASSIIAFGILISSLTRKMRTSILTILGLSALFLGVQWLGSILSELDSGALSEVVRQAGASLVAMAGVVNLVSPFSHLLQGMRAIALGNYTGYVFALVFSLGYSGMMLVLAVVVFARKGVRS